MDHGRVLRSPRVRCVWALGVLGLGRRALPRLRDSHSVGVCCFVARRQPQGLGARARVLHGVLPPGGCWGWLEHRGYMVTNSELSVVGHSGQVFRAQSLLEDSPPQAGRGGEP